MKVNIFLGTSFQKAIDNPAEFFLFLKKIREREKQKGRTQLKRVAAYAVAPQCVPLEETLLWESFEEMSGGQIELGIHILALRSSVIALMGSKHEYMCQHDLENAALIKEKIDAMKGKINELMEKYNAIES